MNEIIVNGVQVEFDPFDLDNMEAYLEGVERIDKTRREKFEGESAVQMLRRICDDMLDFFDDILGEGKAREIFGAKTNVKTINDGYMSFCQQVNTSLQTYTKSLNAPAAPRAVNREQRRQNRS